MLADDGSIGNNANGNFRPWYRKPSEDGATGPNLKGKSVDGGKARRRGWVSKSSSSSNKNDMSSVVCYKNVEKKGHFMSK